MRILVDIGHPAHVHLFKNMIWRFEESGHEVKITVKEKDIALNLLDSYGFSYENLGMVQTGLVNKAIGMVKIDRRLYKISKSFQPDIFISTGSPYAAQVSRLLGRPHVAFSDTEVASLIYSLMKPFTTVICTPSCFEWDLGDKQVKYNGYHELAYLHPDYFKPDPSILDDMKVIKGEKYVIIRFVSWAASHDLGHEGILMENKIKAVRSFIKYARVFITSEDVLPPELEEYRISFSPHRILHAINYATLVYGESATMASEGAVLGTPAIFLDNYGRGYTNEQEKKYGAVYNFTESEKDQAASIEKGVELLKDDEVKSKWAKKRKKILDEKIDVTKFMVDFIEDFPNSYYKFKNK